MYVSKVYEYAVDAYGDVRTLVRGITFQCPDDWEDILDSLDEDSNLYLLKEPDNPKDKLAIAAYLDDRRIGYVAASDNGKIWLYMTDEKMPCQFIERFEASFKIAFENPRPLFEDMSFKEIYKDKYGVTEQPLPAFDIPFLFNPKDKRYEWFDDRIYIADLERVIPDFRRKLATRMINIAGRKNSKGEYNYYLPYANNPIADVEDDIIKGIIDRYGFVIALPDVPVINTHGSISMDMHVTFLKSTNFKDFNAAHQSELVFSLTNGYDANSKIATDVQNVADGNYDSNQPISTDEGEVFMQNPLSTPSYSRQDYILKKGEVADSSIDKGTFKKIDRITTDLYTFVRQKLFPSMELFSYLKKHTPYYNQFYNFGQYETLIKIFTIKDLGRIYKGLNHSFNFDTAEGKILFLYMEKDAGQDPEISYGAFIEICNPYYLLESATKARKVMEKLMKSYYEYDIELWTDTDFMIHSLLKDVDNDLAKRYMELMRQFASFVAGNDKHLVDYSTHPVKNSLPTAGEFFPIEGITLGKTTWKQAEEMGHRVKVWKDGPRRYINVEGIIFSDNDGLGVFTSFILTLGDQDFPLSWKSMGFSWELSYEGWLALFDNLGYNVTIMEEPSRSEFMGHDSLHARFEALSPDKLLLFGMNFDYGENGCYTTSPKTIYFISVTYNGPTVDLANLKNLEVKRNNSIQADYNEEYCSVTDSPEGGRLVSMDVIIPEEGDDDFDFCSYECSISDKKQIDIITNYMKRYEDGKETKPFLMIGRPCFGLDNIDIFYSMDGEIIFNFIFDEKIKSWIREAGFVLGKVKEYHYFNLTSSLNLTLSVSKRKDGEALFKQASEEAMDYIEEYTSSQADHSVEKRIIDAVKNYITGDTATPYKVIIVPEYGVGTCTTLDGEDVAMIVDGEIIDLAKKNKGVFGYITNYEYDDDGDAWFTIRVSRSIPRLTIEQDSKVSITPTKFNTNLSTAFDDFFPIGGITLGETTWEQAEKLGHEVKIWKEGPCRITHIGDCSFYDFEGIGVFTTLFCHNDFYPSWKSKGFSWDLSYDEWMSVFKKLGYKITVTQQPVKKEFSGHDTLSAEFEAVSPDETLLFRLSFDYGNSGCLTSSPRTLYTVCVKSKKR